MCPNMASRYIIICYQREDSNIGQVWARNQSKFYKFLLSFLFYDNLGKMIKFEGNPKFLSEFKSYCTQRLVASMCKLHSIFLYLTESTTGMGLYGMGYISTTTTITFRCIGQPPSTTHGMEYLIPILVHKVWKIFVNSSIAWSLSCRSMVHLVYKSS